MGLLFYLSYVAVLVAFAFVTLSLASGLLYISELIEEYSRFAKVVGQRGIYVIIAFHILLYITDSLPLKQTAFSIFCHIVYLQNFSHAWPYISLGSWTFIASCILVISDHFLWFFYFARLTQDAKHQRYYTGRPAINAPTFTEVATFFGTCVWLVPLFLFLSLSANDNAIPLSSAIPGSPSVSQTQFPQNQPRQSLFRSIFSMLPGSRSKREGLIAPPSPAPMYRSTSGSSVGLAGAPLRSPSLSGTYQNTLSPPPRSPGFRQTQAFELQSVKNSSVPSFQLGNPPTRPSSGLRSGSPLGAAGSSSERIGLGLRRTASSAGLVTESTKEE